MVGLDRPGGVAGGARRAAARRTTEGDDLVYAGKVGTGFSQSVLRDLHARLTKLEVDESPCTKGALPRKAVHWARPRAGGQVAFTEWTSANQLRHPRYLGLRTDKKAADVVREQ